MCDAYERQFFRVVGGLGRLGRRRECGRVEQVTVMESDHHGYDQRHADAKPAPSGGCYHHPFVRRELATDDFRSRVGEPTFVPCFVGRVNRQGSRFSRWGVREAVQVESVRSTSAVANPTQLSTSLTTQRTRELLCRRLRCWSGLKTWFVGPPDAAA